MGILGVVITHHLTDMFGGAVELGMHLVDQVSHGAPRGHRVLDDVETCIAQVVATQLAQLLDDGLASSMRDTTVGEAETFGRRYAHDGHALDGVLDLAMRDLVRLGHEAVKLLLVIAACQVDLRAVLVEAERQLIAHVLHLATFAWTEGDHLVGARMSAWRTVEVGRSCRHRQELQGHLSFALALVSMGGVGMHEVLQVVHVPHLVEPVPVRHLPAEVQHGVLAIGNQLQRHPVSARIALLAVFHLHALTLLSQRIDIHLVDVADVAIHQLRLARNSAFVGHLVASLDIFLKAVVQLGRGADGVGLGGVVLGHSQGEVGSCLPQFVA